MSLPPQPNRLELVASVAAKEPLGYTPAGVPLVRMRLAYAGTVIEAEIPRQLAFEIDAVALGPTAAAANALPLGATARFGGFVASKNRRSTGLVFHLTGIERH